MMRFSTVLYMKLLMNEVDVQHMACDMLLLS